MNEATPRPLACPSERHAADNPCAVDCAVCRDECWPDIVKAVNAHDALVAACEAMRDSGMFDWEGAVAYKEEAALVMAALEAAK